MCQDLVWLRSVPAEQMLSVPPNTLASGFQSYKVKPSEQVLAFKSGLITNVMLKAGHTLRHPLTENPPLHTSDLARVPECASVPALSSATVCGGDVSTERPQSLDKVFAKRDIRLFFVK